MTADKKGLNTLLKRTNLNISFKDFLKVLTQHYPIIDKIESYEPILEGYEDANIKIVTPNDSYILKIFSKVPVTKLVSGIQGNLCTFSGTEPTYSSRYFNKQKLPEEKFLDQKL